MDYVECKELIEERDKMVLGVKNIRVGTNQALRQVEVPEDVILLAKKFIKRAPNSYTRNGISHFLRYQVLGRLQYHGGVYELLMRDAKETGVLQANEKILEWIDALKHLRRYALNLMLAPKRPEFQSMKLYSSFYVYHVANKLGGADMILLAMGYSIPTSASPEGTQELKYIREVDLNHMAEVVTDLVVLTCDLELLKGIAKTLVRDNPELPVMLGDILKARNIFYQTYTNTLEVTINIISQRLSGRQMQMQRIPVPQEIKYPPRMSRPPDEQRRDNSMASDYDVNYLPRRSSEPLLDKAAGAMQTRVPSTAYSDRRDNTAAFPPKRKLSSETNLLWRSNQRGEMSNEQRIRQNSTLSSVGSSSDTDAESLCLSPPTGPPPDPNNLPDPFLHNEAAFSMGEAQLQPQYHRSLSDSISSGVDLFMNARSSFSDDNSLIIDFWDQPEGDGFKRNDSRNCEGTLLSQGGIVYRESAASSKYTPNEHISDYEGTVQSSEARHQEGGRFVLQEGSETLLCRSEQNLQEDLVMCSSGYKHPIELNTRKFKTSPLSSIEEQYEKSSPHSSLKETRKVVESKDKDEDDFVIITEVHEIRERSSHISKNTRVEYEQKNEQKNRDSLDLESNENPNISTPSSHWICDYCTNVNVANVTKCEVCGIEVRI